MSTKMSTKMSTPKLDRLRCTQCSKTYKEIKLLNRHQREKHSQQQRWPCDYPGCSVDFQCLRFKAEHMKKQHAEHISHSIDPAEQSRRGFQQDMPGFMVPSQYKSPYAEITSQISTTRAPETTRLPFSPIVDEDLPTPTAASAYESSSTPHGSFEAPAFLGMIINGSLHHPEHPRRLLADRTKTLDRPSVAPRREPQPNPAPDLLDDTSEAPETFAQSEPAIEGLDDSGIKHMQAIITSIWDRDVETLSKVVDELDIDYFEFSEAATDGLVERLLQDTTMSVSQRQESREALADRWIIDFTPMLRTLTPVSLAIVVGFLDGVICIINRTGWSQRDLPHWLNCLTAKFVSIPQDGAITAFLSYNNRGTRLASSDSRESFSSGLLNSVRDELALCCPDPNEDMPGGTKWLAHAIQRGHFFGALTLLQRGADRNATLADGTPLADSALENGQDEIAVLLLKPWLVVGPNSFYYRHKVLGSSTTGRDAPDKALIVLMRLRYAAEEMKDKVEASTWRCNLEAFIDGILWAEDIVRKRSDVDYRFMDARLGIEISHLL
jgi:hypothetical protein